MTRDKQRSPVPDRARRRAIRAYAARLGVPYSVAARLLRTRPPGSSTDPADDIERSFNEPTPAGG